MLARLWATRLQAAATAPPRRRRGSTGPGSRAWFAEHVPGAEPPLSFERIAGGHSNLTYRVSDAAGRRWALRRPPLGKRLGSAHDMAREHKVVSALGPTEVPVAPVVGLCEDESVNGAPFYVMEFVEGPILRGLAEAEPFPTRPTAAGDRRARRRHPGRDPRGRPRRRRPRRPRPQGGLRRPPAAPLAGPVGEVEDARAGGDRPRPRAPRRPHPRAGPGDDRPRRLPPRQHDPHPVRRGGRGGRLGALHPRRPARRRRPADGLLAGAGRGDDRPRPAGQPGARLPDPRGAGRPATPSAPAATSPSSTSSSPSATGSWRSSSRASTPATPPAATARSTRASSSSPGWSSAWPRRPTRPSARRLSLVRLT